MQASGDKRAIQVVRIGNADIAITRWGTGRPVLLFHGNPDSGVMWDGVAQRLAGDFHCIAPDLPGFGRSQVPAGYVPSLEGMATFVEELRGSLGLTDPVDVVAHDFGGPFAFAWAVTHADAVRRLVAINTLFFSDYRWHFWARVWRTPVLGELSMALMNRVMFARELNRGSGRPLAQAHIDDTWRLMTPRMKKEVLRLYRATDPQAFAGWEERFLALVASKPTLVIWGDRDPYIPSRYAERFNAREVVHLPNAGHWAPVEDPAACATPIARFLSD